MISELDPVRRGPVTDLRLTHPGNCPVASTHLSTKFWCSSVRISFSPSVLSHARCMLSAPKWCLGVNCEGSSNDATVTSMFSDPSLNLNPSEVPQTRQKGRSAIGELSYQSGSCSHCTWACLTLLNAIEIEPVARWHIRQWQR